MYRGMPSQLYFITPTCTCTCTLTTLLCPQELAQYQRNVTQLTTEVEQLRREKADLMGEVEAHKVMVSHVTVTIGYICK